MNSKQSKGRLETLAYRSRAVPSFSGSELESLLESARSRNRAAAVTGLLIYDEGRFFQWLEGPNDSLSNIWKVIRDDPRHTDIEVLDHSESGTRLFGQWDMKLATKGTELPIAPNQPVVVSPELLGSLYRSDHPTSSLLASVSTVRSAVVRPQPEDQLSRRDVLEGMVEKEVIPTLRQRHGAKRSRLPLAHPRAAELAELLIAADPADAFALIDLLQAEAGSIAVSSATVYEPAARSLGELWASDDCTEVDVTLGLGRLQSGVHLAELGSQACTRSGAPLRAVLVAPQPGEVHMLGAVLDAEVLWRDGWDTQCEFPSSDEALNGLVAAKWFDAIDLSLSASFRREHWLPRMAQTIAAARRASLNPEIVVVVGGRVFYEQVASAQGVGADRDSTTALQISQVLKGSLDRLGH
jgi:hypothetical protein